MFVAWPWAPPIGWWIMMREFGSVVRLPLAPAARSTAAMLAAMPMHVQATSASMYCMQS
jgi:hypothetical protein